MYTHPFGIVDINPYLCKKKMGKYLNPISGVYLIRNLQNGKCYVGASVNIKRRWAKHRNFLRSGKHQNKYLQKDFSAGLKNLEYSILELCLKESFVERESHWITFFGTVKEELGYNSILPDGSDIRIEAVENKKRKILKIIICINKETGAILYKNSRTIKEDFKIAEKKIWKLCNYWDKPTSQDVQKSCNGWILVREESYDSNFDYIKFDKITLYRESYIPKPKKPTKKAPEDIITYSDRNINRSPIILQNKETGEELSFPSIIKAIEDLKLVKNKVYLCLNKPFKQRSHRGYYFKRLSER